MQEVVAHDVSEVSFGIYNDEEIKKLSVIRVVSPVTYDRLGNPLQG
jgi:DNA-directed RNA polymerase beta' subunit